MGLPIIAAHASGVWDLVPWLGIEPRSPAMGWVLATGPGCSLLAWLVQGMWGRKRLAVRHHLGIYPDITGPLRSGYSYYSVLPVVGCNDNSVPQCFFCPCILQSTFRLLLLRKWNLLPLLLSISAMKSNLFVWLAFDACWNLEFFSSFQMRQSDGVTVLSLDSQGFAHFPLLSIASTIMRWWKSYPAGRWDILAN